MRIKPHLSGPIALCMTFGLFAQDAIEDENVYELSPFTIESVEDEGYSATSTLAGTRIKTNLEDIGSSITAVTSQFLEDTDSTDLNDLLVYTANTEAAGPNGNYSAPFSAGDSQDATSPGFQSGSSAIINPQGAQRIRGLDSADTTRNLFRSTIRWDSYNTSQVEIVRGASSILFGQGSPAGIINANTIKPFWRDGHKVKVRVDDQGSLRGTFDSNLVLSEDKLAIRIAGLSDHHKFRQDPTFEDDERIFATGVWKISKNLKFRAEGEIGRIRANRPNLFAPTDGFSWYLNNVGLVADPTPAGNDNPRATLPEVPGREFNATNQPRIFIQWGRKIETDGSLVSSDPSVYSFNGILNQANIRPGNPAGLPRRSYIYATTQNPWEMDNTAGFRPVSLSDYSIFDWKNNSLAGEFPFQDTDLHTFNGALEYLSDGGHFGAELSFDYQYQEDHNNRGPTTARDYVIRLDVGAQNIDGSPNPNLFRPFMPLTQTMRGTSYREVENESVQFNGFARVNFQQDLGWDHFLGKLLGTQTLTLFGSKNEVRTENRLLDDSWTGPNIVTNAGNGFNSVRLLGHPHRDVTSTVYLGGPITGFDDISISPIGFSGKDYNQSGETIMMNIWDKDLQNFTTVPYTIEKFLQSANDLLNETETIAAVLQSDWWDGILTTVMGVRRDSITNSITDYGTVDGTDRVKDLNQPTTRIQEGADTYFSWSGVLRTPDRWDLPFGTRASVFYSESENFDPSATGRVSALGTEIGPPTGTTKDYGIRINTFNDKLELKLNFYETSFIDSTFTGGGLATRVHIEKDFRFRERTYFLLLDDGYLDPADNILTEFGEPPANLIAAHQAELNDQGVYVFTVNNDVTDTSDITSEGIELEVVYNPTRNWRILFNASRQETVRSNSLPFTRKYVAERLPTWEKAFDYAVNGSLAAIEDELPLTANGFVDWPAFAQLFPERTRRAQYDSDVRVPLQAIIDQDGGVVQEQREWRLNLVTNYNFSRDSRLAGFNIGGGVRWQDESAIGFPWKINEDGQQIVDVENPFFGPDQTNIDAWVGYKREIMDGKVDWKIQLNVRNLFADDEPIPVNADNFGNYGQYRLPPLTSWAVTNTFSF